MKTNRISHLAVGHHAPPAAHNDKSSFDSNAHTTAGGRGAVKLLELIGWAWRPFLTDAGSGAPPSGPAALRRSHRGPLTGRNRTPVLNNASARWAPEAYEDGDGFHCECGFMAEYRRRERRFLIGMWLLVLAGGVLAILWRSL